nr:ATP-binding protein [uncultured Desulfobulbus sp.]
MRFGLKLHIIGLLLALLALASGLTLFVTLSFWSRDAAFSFSREKELTLHLLAEHQFYRYLSVGYESEYARALLQEAMEQHGAVVGCVRKQGAAAFCLGGSDDKSMESLEKILALTSSGSVVRRFIGTQWVGLVSGKQYLDLGVQVTGPDQAKYPVALRFSLYDPYYTIWSLQRYIALYLLFNVLVLTVVGFFRIRQFLLKPVERLLQLTQSYKDEHGVPFLALQESGELAQLQVSLQQMLGRIRADREKLEQHLVSLEQANAQLHNTQQEMIRAEKLSSVGRLAAGMAHEIGNPVGIVQGYLGMLGQGEVSIEERKDFCQRAEQELYRISTLIRQLLDFARPATGKEMLVAPHEVIKGALALLRPQPLFDSIEIDDEWSAGNVQIFCDPDQLLQVLLNCLMNGADAIVAAGTKKGRIWVRTELCESIEGSLFMLTIADNGCGLSQEQLAAAFDPFYTTKPPGSGTGLGLSVSYALLEQMKGSITLSNHDGGGAKVVIKIPVALSSIAEMSND